MVCDEMGLDGTEPTTVIDKQLFVAKKNDFMPEEPVYLCCCRSTGPVFAASLLIPFPVRVVATMPIVRHAGASGVSSLQQAGDQAAVL